MTASLQPKSYPVPRTARTAAAVMIPLSLLVLALVIVIAFGAACRPVATGRSRVFTVSSPDGALSVSFSNQDKPRPYLAGRRPYYRVTYKGKAVLNDSPLGLDLTGAPALDSDFEIVSIERRFNDTSWENAFGPRRKVVDRFNELAVRLRERHAPNRRLDIVFRAYDEGIAFRYVLPKQQGIGKFALAAELTGFYFAGDAPAAGAPASSRDQDLMNEMIRSAAGEADVLVPPVPVAFALNMGRFNTHNEGEYAPLPLSDIKPVSIINLPLLVEMPGGGPWAALLEADLTDYAGLYVGGVAGIPNALAAKLSTPPRKKVDETVVGATPKATPWRVLMVAPTPGRLIETSDIVLNLSEPCRVADTSWIKPGKAAWDWWSGSYAERVPFKPGMNTATMKHYIDFAAAHGLEYMLVDAGWAPPAADGRLEDIMRYIPECDVPAVIAYGRAKGVRVLLWVEWQALDARLDEAMALYEKWGAAGIKVDYMNRDDQEMVNYYEKVVATAAAHHLTVDFHGAYKETGLRRAWPNLLTREGVMGMEYNKWSERVTPEYDVTIPFTRMLAGPMDFTPGAMRNAARGKFKALDIAPMSQGTRAHQLAMYVVYESPLVMVSDFPEAYEGQPGLEFIEKAPTVWDDTRVPAGMPAKYVVVARRSGERWFLGAMTNWDARDLEIALDFLGAGEYEAKIFADGPDAAANGTSLAVETKRVTAAGGKLAVHLAPGGGCAAIFTPVKPVK